MRTSLRGLAFGLIVLLAAPAVASEPDEAAGIAVQRVRIVDFRFRPGSVTIERGDVVRWRNRGDVNHTSTSDDGLWNSGTLSPGESFRKRFRRRGVFEYHCDIHPNMTARIRVV